LGEALKTGSGGRFVTSVPEYFRRISVISQEAPLFQELAGSPL